MVSVLNVFQTDTATLIREGLIAIVLLIYVLGVVFFTKVLYSIMRKHGMPHNVAVYYNRKVIHIAAGGIVALLTPFLFTTPIIPFLMALVLALLVYLPHRRGKLMYWFQVPENMYEVNFCISWGISLLTLWIILGDARLAILPPLLISFGDAITGIVRNALFRRRTKHWIGNVAMAAVTVPIGIAFAGPIGGVASLAASIIERIELNPIDDNVLIATIATIVLLIGKFLALY